MSQEYETPNQAGPREALEQQMKAQLGQEEEAYQPEEGVMTADLLKEDVPVNCVGGLSS